MKSSRFMLVALVGAGVGIVGGGCLGSPDVDERALAEDVTSCDDPALGEVLFETETFGGNGRTCGSCHSEENGTLTLDQIGQRYAANPSDPLFRHDAHDSFPITSGVQVGTSGTVGFNGAAFAAIGPFSRFRTHGTIAVGIDLHPNVTLIDHPQARSVHVARSIPTIFNIALTSTLMADGRLETLEEQVRAAVAGHFQPARLPTDCEVRAIVAYEKTLFSSETLRTYFTSGRNPDLAPQLPPGRTAAEIRGRRFFEDRRDPADEKVGTCASCHSGPMLDRRSPLFIGEDLGIDRFAIPDDRHTNPLTSEFNAALYPEHQWGWQEEDGDGWTITSPDAGRGVVTGFLLEYNAFKSPTLWGVKHTAPYFHDGSAHTLDHVMNHYEKLFATLPIFERGRLTPLTPQDKADILAYLQLL